MDGYTFTIVALIGVALLFDFLNGLHDAANSIATVVSTRVLSPQLAVVWAAFFNFIAFLFFSHAVANTIGKGIIDPDIVTPAVIFGALMGAIIWNLLTWLLGIPSSSSHALVGGLVGAGVAAGGFSAVVAWGVIKTALFIFLAPILGMVDGDHAGDRSPHGCSSRSRRAPRTASSAASSSSRPRPIRSATAPTTRRRRWGSSPSCSSRRACCSGEFHVPFWVVITCQAAMGLGTLMGGWRIVHTMGSKITRLTPHQGFCAETGGAFMLFGATAFGIPVSTTHTITGAIMGVGAARRASAVRWGVAGNIVVAWFLTIPAAALVAAGFYGLTRAF